MAWWARKIGLLTDQNGDNYPYCTRATGTWLDLNLSRWAHCSQFIRVNVIWRIELVGNRHCPLLRGSHFFWSAGFAQIPGGYSVLWLVYGCFRRGNQASPCFGGFILGCRVPKLSDAWAEVSRLTWIRNWSNRPLAAGAFGQSPDMERYGKIIHNILKNTWGVL